MRERMSCEVVEQQIVCICAAELSQCESSAVGTYYYFFSFNPSLNASPTRSATL